MPVIKVNVRDQRKRFYQLLNAMMRHEQVEGCTVTGYTEFKEQGERYARFTLDLARDKIPCFGA